MQTGIRIFAALGMAAALLAAPQDNAAEATTLRVAINASDVANLDPHRASSTGDKTLVGWMFNGLVRFPPGSANPAEIEPDLAESWTVSVDGLVWTFKLREGVKFHGDSGVLTADDGVEQDWSASASGGGFWAKKNAAKLLLERRFVSGCGGTQPTVPKLDLG
jgi:peptide/nickel transport system substrate-binding protein